MTELDIRKAICEAGRRLYAKNLIAATDGNLSARIGSGRYVCTPSGVSKGFMSPRDLIIADGKGNKLAGEGRVTSEFFTHLAAYEERPEMNAVVHAHPPKAIAFTLAGESLADCVLPEVVYTIGGIPAAEYATPGTPEGGKAIRELIRQCDALMMDRHGALTIGVDVFDALFKMEKVEHAAETLLTAKLLGRVRKLEAEEVAKLYQVRESYGVSGRAFRCSECGHISSTPSGESADERLDQAVEESLRLLGKT